MGVTGAHLRSLGVLEFLCFCLQVEVSCWVSRRSGTDDVAMIDNTRDNSSITVYVSALL